MLTVLSVAYPFAVVDDDPAGGAEQMLSGLDRALVAAGHRSIVIAAAGSTTVGEVRTLPPHYGAIDAAAWATAHAAVRDLIAKAVADDRIDLIHLHGFDFAAIMPPPGPPVLVTLHLPLAWHEREALRIDRPRTFLLPVSADQAARAPDGVSLLPPIANGVDLARYRPARTSGDCALILGRVAAEKGFHHALDAARLAGIPLRAAGQVFAYPEHQRYFDEQIAPRLDSDRRWIGPVAGAVKRRLLAEARCLLVPSTAAETSSLVAMEALASGTPVIAYRAGALPTIVEHGVTGFVVNDVAGMADAIGRINMIDRAACRRAACDRFDLARTAAAYLDLYERLA